MLLLFTRRFARVHVCAWAVWRVCALLWCDVCVFVCRQCDACACVRLCGRGGASCYYRGVVAKPISGVYDVTFTSPSSSAAAVLALHHAAPAAMTRTGRAWNWGPRTGPATTMTKAIFSHAVSCNRCGGEEGEVRVENPSDKTKQKNCKNMQKENTRLTDDTKWIYSYTCATVAGV